MKNLFILSIYLLIIPNGLFSQNTNDKTLWGEVDLGYGFSLADRGKSYNLSYNDFSEKMYLASIRVKAGYYITPQLSLGAGLGLDGYHNTNINTFPVFIDLQYRLKSIPKLFAYVNGGASVALSDAYTSGFISGIGMGYRVALGKRIILKPSIGYDLFLYSQNLGVSSETRSRHTLSMRLGFEF
jgi:hypothetical protein